ncbi:TIGR02444 family protein [Salipiger pacificus]|nr:TIGR02444 family protein [Alloyangia pacifica]MCA0946267.1 TIGR02444 family protein [Alloyangia pacifica]
MEREKFCTSVFAEMVKFYGSSGISGECLNLQHEFDADVPIFLICVLADRAGHGLSDPAFSDWIGSATEWRETVIRPLRSVRVTLKPKVADPAANALRERIKAVELEAEKLHVEALADGFLAGAGEGDLAPRYLRLLGLREAEIARRMAPFLAADTP